MAIFEPLLTTDNGEKLIPYFWLRDATYIYTNKHFDAAMQKETYLKYKSSNVWKSDIIVSGPGKIIKTYPLTASISPRMGDGNIASYFINLEATDDILSSTNMILCSELNDVINYIFHDNGYNVHLH